MSPDHDPLKPMGVQSADTVQVEAAERAKQAKEESDQAAATVAEGAEIAEMALEDTAEWIRVRSKVAADMAAAFVRERPVEAMLVACAAGALVMGLVLLASRRD